MVRGHETIAVGGHDIKIGRGGIREIEFFVRPSNSSSAAASPPCGGVVRSRCWPNSSRRAGSTGRPGRAACGLHVPAHPGAPDPDDPGRATQRLPTGTEALTALALFAGFFRPGGLRGGAAPPRRPGPGALRPAVRAGPEAGGDGPPWSSARASRSPRPWRGSAPSGSGIRPWPGRPCRAGISGAARPCGPAGPGRSSPRCSRRCCGRSAEPPIRTRRSSPSTGPSRGCPRGGTPRHPALARAPAPPVRRHPGDGTPRLADTVGLSPHVLDTVLDADFVTPTTDPDQVRAQYRALLGQPASHEESPTAAGTPRGR